MKAIIDYDERYPDFYITKDGDWGKEIEISEEEYELIEKAQNDYYAAQSLMRKLYGYNK